MLKKWIGMLCAAVLSVSIFASPAAAAEDLAGVPSKSYIVIDADSGQVIMEKNADEVRFPASITKIMTLGLAIEKANGDWDQTVTVSYDAVHQLEFGSDHVALMEGEIVRLEDLFYATEMPSANDAANVLAEYIGDDGSIQSGVDKMNQKAAELGLSNTHYMNPHGLHDDEHYTTARDMAKITKWALSIPGFEEVFTRNEPWFIEPTNKQPQQRPCRHSDWMRISGDYYRDYAKGSKTGFTNQAEYTFVNYAVQGDVRLISVEMGCPSVDGRMIAANMLLDYAFTHFHHVTIPAPQDTFLVELVGGGGPLGSVTVKAADANFLLHDSLNATDVYADYSIPEQYVLGQPFTASVQFSLRENDVQSTFLGSDELEVDGLPQILQANTYIPQASLRPEKNPVGVILGVAAALVALLLAVRLLSKGKKMRPNKEAEWEASPAEWEFLRQQPRQDEETLYLSMDRGSVAKTSSEKGTSRHLNVRNKKQ